MASQQLLLGAGAAKKLGVEDVVSSHTWIGDGATTRTINNGVDLAGKGGLTIIKASNLTQPWFFTDTVRGATKTLRFNTSSGQSTDTTALKSFTSSGFTIGNDAATNTSGGSIKYCSQSFAIKEGFFDIQEWSGNGTAGRTISHDLGLTPRCIMIKCITHGHDWVIFHGQLGAGKKLTNSDSLQTDDSTHWNNTWPTSSVFTVGNTSNTNESGKDYIAYIFPLTATAEYGESEDQTIFGTSDVTPNSSSNVTMDIGFEPGIVILKKVQDNNNNGGDWYLYDRMRDVTTGNDSRLEMNTASTETTNADVFEFTSTGFTIKSNHPSISSSGQTWLYWAWAAPTGKVMKNIKTATDVFAMDTGNNVNSTMSNFDSGFAVDFALMKKHSATSDWYSGSRLTGMEYMKPQATSAAGTLGAFMWQSNVGWNNVNYDNAWQSWMWKRHRGFDVTIWMGNGSNRNITHNLYQTPEMVWVKKRNDTSNWTVYHKGLNGGTNPEQYYLHLDESTAENTGSDKWNNNAPNGTHLKLGTSNSVNENTHTYIAMLFASVSGISKVGYFTNSGGTTTVSCGFQPRFVIVKCSGSSGNWYVYDTLRGINTGGDPSLNLNSDAASGIHTADDIDINSDGFTIPTSSSNIGFSDTHIFYAHA